MKAIDQARYDKAQEYEGGYWKSRQRDPVGLIRDLEGSFVLAQHMQRAGLLEKDYDRFLDLGCGALGVGSLWLISAKEKHGIDPLSNLPPATGNHFIDQFVEAVQSGVKYVCGGGELLPYRDEYFDFIICNNVLDHVHNPYKILSEVWRTLTPCGIFAFSVDTHSWRSILEKKVAKIINPNSGSLPGHPYEWTESQMTQLLLDHRFEITSHIPRSIKGRLAGAVRRSTYLLKKIR